MKEEEEIIIITADIIIQITTIIIIKIIEIIMAIITKMTTIKVETEIDMIDRTIKIIIDKKEMIMMKTETGTQTKIEGAN